MEAQMNSMLVELFQQAKEMIIVLHRSGKIAFINSNAREKLQLCNSELNHLKFTGKSKSEWNRFISTIETDTTASCIVSILNDYNEEISIKILGYLIESEGVIFGRVVLDTSKEMTKDKFNQSSKFQQLLNGMATGVVLTSPNGKIISANAVALKLINREYWQIEQRSHDCLFEECSYDSSLIIRYYKKIANNELTNVIVKKMDASGNLIFLNFISKIDEALGVLITTVVDYTETMDLLDKIAHQQNLSLMGQNVAIIAHEIRNPMTSIQGFIQMIKSNSTDKEHPYFDIVESELQRMDELLVDLLDFSKPKQPEFSYVNFQQLIEEVIELMQPKVLLSNSTIVFEYNEQESFILYGNENRLKQLVINLLKNAIESSEVSNYISLQLGYKTPDCMQLSIQDQGIGMNKTTLESIFNPFYSTKESGTGLGLLLVQSIVNEHHGSIQIESEEGKGTKFIVDFDLNYLRSRELSSFNPDVLDSKVSYM